MILWKRVAFAASEQRQVSANELSLLQVSFAKETCEYYYSVKNNGSCGLRARTGECEGPCHEFAY